MTSDVITQSLALSGFAIDFDIKLPDSARDTRGLKPPGVTGFIFAVADVSLRTGKDRYVVISEFETGNLLELFRRFADAASTPHCLAELEQLIEPGGLSAWMHGYWSRIHDDSVSAEDEVIYERISPLRVASDGDGCIAVYQYAGAPIIEVSGQRSPNQSPVVQFCEFDQKSLTAEITGLGFSISDAIKRWMIAH